MKRRTLLVGGAMAVAGGALGVGASLRSMGSANDYAAAMAHLRRPLDPAGGVAEILRFATLAANGHNTQPWRFMIGANQIRLLPDLQRRTPVVDPDDHHVWSSLGCAAANLQLAAAATGRHGEIVFEAADGGALVFLHHRGSATGSPLLAAIPHRQSTRAEFDGLPLSTADLDVLAQASQVPGVALVLLTERDAIARARDLVLAGNATQLADPAFLTELKQWLRFNPAEALTHGDGLYSAASGNPTLPSWIAPFLFDRVFTTSSENAKYARQIDSSAGIAAFLADHNDADHWARAGIACQRFTLQATALGVKTAFVNQPGEVAGLRDAFAALCGLPGRRPDLIVRFGRGPTLPYSPRRAPQLA